MPRSVLCATLLVMAAFAASRVAILGEASEREYDEGVYLLSARSVVAGHPLFTSVFSSQPPAFLETLAAAMRLAGDSLETARMLILAFSLLSLAAVADLGRRLAGPWAAPAAAAALALSARFGDLGHVVQAETPALAMALLSLCAALHARARLWHRAWLAASGGLMALALLFKLLVAPMLLPLGLLLLFAPSRGPNGDWETDGRGTSLCRRAAARAFVVASGALVALALPLLRYDSAAFFEQTVGFHLAKREVFGPNPLGNVWRLLQQLPADGVVLASAVAGAALLARARPRAASWLGVWMLWMSLALALQTPLFWRHFILYAPPLALAAAALPVFLAERRRSRTPAFWVAVAVTLWALPPLLLPRQVDAMFPLIPEAPRHEIAAESLRDTALWIRRQTKPDEMVGGDDPMAVYLAGRQAPPRLCDTSLARIASRSLELREATTHSLAARVLVLRREGRLSRSLPGYLAWVKRNYRLVQDPATGLEPARSVWLRRPNARPSPLPRKPR
ncbi:MAG: glycosyltransferase family 39 protein [Candidatus Binatia bacterium]